MATKLYFAYVIVTWLKIFREGYENLENDPRSGQA